MFNSSGTRDYNKLQNKPTIPTKTSQLSNDSQFVTKTIRTDNSFGLSVEVRTSDPTSPTIGQMWLRSDLS